MLFNAGYAFQYIILLIVSRDDDAYPVKHGAERIFPLAHAVLIPSFVALIVYLHPSDSLLSLPACFGFASLAAGCRMQKNRWGRRPIPVPSFSGFTGRAQSDGLLA
ncbi:hypothetical protein D1872_254910 [compost metagenome]